MRPKSAMFYIDQLSHVSQEMIDKIETMVDDNRKVNISPTLSEFALDAVAVIFIGSNLGVLQGSQYGKDMIEAVGRMFYLGSLCIAIPPKIAKYVPQFKEYVKRSADIYLLSQEKINESLKVHIFFSV